MELNKYIEHTLLKQDATREDLEKLLKEACEYSFLGVCVNPCNVKLAKQFLKETGYNEVKVVTVVGFPLGQTTTENKVLETVDAIKNGADEIDMVINAGRLKDKDYNYIVDEISKIKAFCQGRNLKVILETDLLTKEEIKKACELCIQGGADFVKTSTGFVKNGVGAKEEDVKLMYETVKDAGLKVKASGGIRDKETAIKMIEAGASRLGTSSGAKICS
ncbi:deoxyribose-phosphate aldolase [bacterium]|jgi:deoxyribose-phosphate aldolase|nr:deoxyribose-phosphate aldolase [bacterium]OLA72386.1 MAG: deoxyribose-phosphate aldolase [Acinetobacter sp. CAG:196_36_41]DAB12199.1 MAG TPA: deoxyribose-phosphate aldolase [Candidatus Gastranaerophilales bacterium HUM_17]DAB18443.1 MAG TPA: deoxyribose-phosphate aldolase [Candidatus Gastranaerophilales bacterium HUM_19]